MKANHNGCVCVLCCVWVVANISCSKNESKSQRKSAEAFDEAGCCKYQLFKE
jgi:hypothetical protein